MAGEPACMARELPHLRQRWQPAHCWVHLSLSQATVPELIIYRLLIDGPCKLRSRNSKETLVIQ